MAKNFGRQVPAGADPALGPSIGPSLGAGLPNPFAGTGTGKPGRSSAPKAPRAPRVSGTPKGGGSGSKGGFGSGKNGGGPGKASGLGGKPPRAPRGSNNYESM